MTATADAIETTRWTNVQRAIAFGAALVGVVLRWWGLGSTGLSFDESFTAAYSSLPLGEIPSALRANDSHPPLDYVLRHWFADTHSELWLRAPSAVMATVALVVVVWWMRRRSWFGVAVVVLFALSPFQILHAHEARMYAAMALIGVLVAVVSERWVRGQGDRRLALVVGLLILLACLDHAGGLFLAAGVLLVPGLRRDRAAWEWRAAPVLAVAVWAVVWGPSFLSQAERNSGLWIPHTNVRSVDSLANGMVSLLQGTGGLVTCITVAGGIALVTMRPRLGRLWSALFVVPFLLVVVVGFRYRIVIPRTLAASAWAVPVAWAALLEWLLRRWKPVAAFVAVLMAVVSLRSMSTAVAYDEGYSEPAVLASRVVEPGDGLLVHPGWLWPLAWWNADTDRGTEPPAGLEGWYWVRPGAESTGRTWVLAPISYGFDPGQRPSCGPTERVGAEWVLGCLVTGSP